MMYHHIRSGEGHRKVAKDLSCEPSVFKNHLNYLQNNGYTTTTFLDILNGVEAKNPVILTFDDGTISQWIAFEELKSRKMKGVFFVVCSYIGNRGYLNLGQLKEIASSGMEIGSHSIGHPNLNGVSQSRLESEILWSKVILEKFVHTRVVSFCYPYGKYDHRVLDTLNGSEYFFARTTDEGIKDIGIKDFKIKILYIHNSTRDLSKVMR